MTCGCSQPDTSRPGPRSTVLLHGAGFTRSAVLDQADVLWRHGFGVLLLDARDHDDSEGRAMDFGWYGDDDVRGLVDRLPAARRRPHAHRCHGTVHGQRGGDRCRGHRSSIAAVVAEGATGRAASDLGWLSDQYGGGVGSPKSGRPY